MDDIYWIRNEEAPRLAIVARPRGDDWLGDDLASLKRGRIDVLVSLLEPEEAGYLGLGHEGEEAARVGLEFISYPIADTTTPDDEESFRRVVVRLVDLVSSGKCVGVHCRGSIGRSTVLTAAVLIQLGIEPGSAIALIREARGCAVPDTAEQLKWILNFKPQQ